MSGDTVTGEVVSPEGAPAAIQTYFDSINAENFQRLATVWTNDVELQAVGARPLRGRDEVMEFYSRIFEPWAKHYDDPRRALVGGDLVVVDIAFRGTSHSGQEIEFPALDVFELEDGKIGKLSIWYDLVWVRKQLA